MFWHTRASIDDRYILRTCVQHVIVVVGGVVDGRANGKVLRVWCRRVGCEDRRIINICRHKQEGTRLLNVGRVMPGKRQRGMEGVGREEHQGVACSSPHDKVHHTHLE